MRLHGLVRYMCACMYGHMHARLCQSMRDRERERETEMRVGVCMCACGYVGGSDTVYGCRCEGGQDENSDYTCASYIAYYSYSMCELLFILQCISVTNIILSNNVYDISIVCLLLRS